MTQTNESIEPRAFTEEEVTEQFLKECVHIADYWGNLPNTSQKDAAEGAVFGMLAMMDGCGDFPAVDLVIVTDPDTNEHHPKEGENYYKDTVISTMLHELFFGVQKEMRELNK